MKALEALRALDRVVFPAAIAGDAAGAYYRAEDVRAAIAALEAELAAPPQAGERQATLKIELEYGPLPDDANDTDDTITIYAHGTERDMRFLDARLKFLHKIEQAAPVAAQPAAMPDSVREALQRLIENAAAMGPGSRDDALLVVQWRDGFETAQEPRKPQPVRVEMRAEDIRDAVRFRWLDAHPFAYFYEAPGEWFIGEHGPHPSLSAAIDAAMQADSASGAQEGAA